MNVELTETIAMELSQIGNSAEIGTYLVFEDCGIRRTSIRSANYPGENTTVSIPLE
jgi:NDP-sugar pyrophosphorylase family protein